MRGAGLIKWLNRGRFWLRCRGLDGRPVVPLADLGVRLRRRRSVHLGPSVRMLRGCEVNATGGTIAIGADSAVCRWAVLQAAGGSIEIGERTLIGDFCNLYGQGGLRIGSDVMLASGVRVLTAEHEIDAPGPVAHSPERTAPTSIGDGAWLATNCVILAGVTVGDGAVVAAGAVVTKDVPAHAIAGGVPARVIRMRRGAVA